MLWKRDSSFNQCILSRILKTLCWPWKFSSSIDKKCTTLRLMGGRKEWNGSGILGKPLFLAHWLVRSEREKGCGSRRTFSLYFSPLHSHALSDSGQVRKWLLLDLNPNDFFYFLSSDNSRNHLCVSVVWVFHSSTHKKLHEPSLYTMSRQWNAAGNTTPHIHWTCKKAWILPLQT